MKRRSLLTIGCSAAVGALFAKEPVRPIGVPIYQEPLPFDFDALEPHMDAATLRHHYNEIHAGYARDLQQTLRSLNLDVANLSSLLPRIKSIVEPPNVKSVLHLGRKSGPLPEESQKALRLYAGGHHCHTVFWRFLAPPGTGQAGPKGKVAQAIQSQFGSIDDFKRAFTKTALEHEGSGWAWLVYRPDGKLVVTTTSYNDHPKMKDFLPEHETGRPVLCLDLWEHSHAGRHHGDRRHYIEAWWNVVNWKFMSTAYEIVTTTTTA